MTGELPAHIPVTKAARQRRIVELISASPVRSQSDLAERLAREGISVTQSTLSKDLVELGASRVRSSSGQLIYAVPREGGERSASADESTVFGAKLARVAADVLVSASASANLVVLRTPPGAAQYFASAIDHAAWPGVLGTIAGDDTIMVIAADPDGGQALAQDFLDLVAQDR